MKKGHPCNCQCESGCEPVITLRSFGLASGDFLWEQDSFTFLGLSPDNKIWGFKAYTVSNYDYDYKIQYTVNTSTYTAQAFSFYGGPFGGADRNRFIDKNNAQHQFLNQNTSLYYNINLGYVDTTGSFITTMSGYYNNRVNVPFNDNIGREHEKGCVYLENGIIAFNNGVHYVANNSGLVYTPRSMLKPSIEIVNGYELNNSGQYIINPFCLVPTSGQPTTNARWKISSSGNRWTNTIGPTVTFPLYANTGEVVSALSALPSISGITASGGPLGRKPMILDITWTTSSGNFDFVTIEGVEAKTPIINFNTGYVDGYNIGFTSFCSNDPSGIISVTSASTSLSVPRGDICKVEKLPFKGISSHPYIYSDYNYTWRTQLWGGLTRTVNLQTVNGPYGPYQDSVNIVNNLSQIKNGKICLVTNRRRSPSGSTWYDSAILNESVGSITYNGWNNISSTEVPNISISNDDKIVSFSYRVYGTNPYGYNINGSYCLYKSNFSDFFNNTDMGILLDKQLISNFLSYRLLSNTSNLIFAGTPANSTPLETGYLSSGTFYGASNLAYSDGIQSSVANVSFKDWTHTTSINIDDISFHAYNSDFQWQIHLVNNSRTILKSTNWMSFGASVATIQAEVDSWYGTPNGTDKAVIVTSTLVDNSSKSTPSFLRDPSDPLGFIQLRQRFNNGWVPLNTSIAISYRNKIIPADRALISYNVSTDAFTWRREVGTLPLQYGYSLTNKYSTARPLYCDSTQVIAGCTVRQTPLPTGVILG